MEETLRFVENKKRKEEIKKLLEKGYLFRCLSCNTVYKEKKQEFYNDGHGGRYIDMCSCGCDLFQPLEEMTCLQVELEPVDGVLVFKEHHAKYCKCDNGEIWTGDSETECHPDFQFLEKKGDRKTYKCLNSGLKIVILKSTKKELESPDELGSAFLRIPG